MSADKTTYGTIEANTESKCFVAASLIFLVYSCMPNAELVSEWIGFIGAPDNPFLSELIYNATATLTLIVVAASMAPRINGGSHIGSNLLFTVLFSTSTLLAGLVAAQHGGYSKTPRCDVYYVGVGVLVVFILQLGLFLCGMKAQTGTQKRYLAGPSTIVLAVWCLLVYMQFREGRLLMTTANDSWYTAIRILLPLLSGFASWKLSLRMK